MIKKQPSQFDRFISLIGKDQFLRLRDKKILVVGIGGVGGYVVESLVRSGISSIAIIDRDSIDITNINRQIIATHSMIGKDKVEVMEKRIQDINPECIVNKYKLFLDDKTINQINLSSYDFIIDCCDTLATKELLIKQSIKDHIPLISCMGTANKFNPSKLEVTKLSKTINDPLAKRLRKFVKDEKIKKDIIVVSSKELPIKNKNILGTNSCVPAVAGLLISNYVIKQLIYK